MKKVVSLLLCLATLLSFATNAFADGIEMEQTPADISAAVTYSTVTMQHTDVVVRSAPGTSNSKVGTLYIGQTVTVTNWRYQQVGTYWWVQILWNTSSGYGYVREDLIP